ncbi:MAG: sensor histidine kinase [Candidatus Cohnella colombiensis]|uniref:Sensor histidine kinase n=1 Tax=Candidatus Cohnella colombiensis TaxID=3121368 RepID=A0AA95EXG4_9BACL|nr:MAG: sensor histidine kinase [Cohnella sp.]
MHRYARRFNDMKLRNKMVWSYMLVFILPIMVIGFFVVQEFRQTALEHATQQSESTVERVASRVHELLSVPVLLANQLTLDSDLADVATTNYQSVYQVVDAYRNYKKFKTFLDFNTEVKRFKIYVDNPTLIDNWEFTPLDEQTRATFWYRAAIEQTGRLGWYYFKSISRSSDSMLSLVRSVYFPENRSVGLLQIDVNTTELSAFLRQEEPEIALADEMGIVVASNRSEMIGKGLADLAWGEQIAGLGPGKYELSANGVVSKVIVENIWPENSYNDLKIVSVFPVESIMKEANRITSVGFQILIVVFLVALVLIYSICTVLTNRLLKFNKQISKVSMGNFNTELIVDGNDEIGQIKRQFNQMVGSIRELMEEVQASSELTRNMERKQNEIQLKMLASQINPHFLYNALESIRMKAHVKGEKEISQTVKMLGKLMRKNLELTGKEIHLLEEFDIIRCYLEIQKFRHEDRISFELYLDPAAEKAKIMPLLIQPLVENSVVHGLEKAIGGGTVAVRAWLEDDKLNVIVEDDGIGMTETKFEEVLRSLSDEKAERIGLHNIQQRLLMTYGEASGLKMESKLNKGTRMSFIIPAEGDGSDV